ncbi:molybdopterin-binding protein [Actinoplanes sp. NPDC023936]|uniref:molybdopterin molybdotransferase MoeA n=1 Tax=Actinoplanes sp. NPDC023936 TaxID=3154910 RepID=UPI0034062CB9
MARALHDHSVGPGSLLPWSRAHALAREVAEPLPGHPVAVVAAGGQVLAEAVHGVRPVPAFDNAAMDGYAVSGPGPWSVTGLLLAGGFTTLPSLVPGEAVEIATGAPVPHGATAVLPYEESALGESALGADRVVSGVVGTRTHIRRAGETLGAGELVAPAGRVVTATLAAAALQAGVDKVVTHRPPTVTLLVTGDEVVDSGAPGPGQVRDTFTGLVTAITTRAGGHLRASRHQRDDPASLAAALDRADTDVIVVSGSSSAGAADHLHALLTARAATWHVRGVACRPGHPQALASLPSGPAGIGRWVVSLPGNPFAGLVAALTLLEPLLETMAGRVPRPLPTIPVTGAAKPMPGGVRIVPVSAAGILPESGPAGLQAAALADSLAVLPDGWSSGEAAALLTLP